MSKRHREQQAMLLDMEARYEGPKVQKKKNLKPLEAKTEAQAHYLMAIESKQLTFGIGPAGTGKTYVCTRYAAELLQRGEIQKIIVTRPAIEAGEGLGFLPGTIQEKFAPYFAPFRAVFDEVFGASAVDNMIKLGKIDIQPLEYIRGLTFDNCVVILDEGQNTTPSQMKLFLSRIGRYAKVIVNGDVTQKDIPGISGLIDAVNRLEHLEAVGVIEFEEDDIVRSGLVRDIIKAYRT